MYKFIFLLNIFIFRFKLFQNIYFKFHIPQKLCFSENFCIIREYWSDDRVVLYDNSLYSVDIHLAILVRYTLLK